MPEHDSLVVNSCKFNKFQGSSQFHTHSGNSLLTTLLCGSSSSASSRFNSLRCILYLLHVVLIEIEIIAFIDQASMQASVSTTYVVPYILEYIFNHSFSFTLHTSLFYVRYELYRATRNITKCPGRLFNEW